MASAKGGDVERVGHEAGLALGGPPPGLPPNTVATTGFACSIASRFTIPKVSKQMEGVNEDVGRPVRPLQVRPVEPARRHRRGPRRPARARAPRSRRGRSPRAPSPSGAPGGTPPRGAAASAAAAPRPSARAARPPIVRTRQSESPWRRRKSATSCLPGQARLQPDGVVDRAVDADPVAPQDLAQLVETTVKRCTSRSSTRRMARLRPGRKRSRWHGMHFVQRAS